MRYAPAGLVEATLIYKEHLHIEKIGKVKGSMMIAMEKYIRVGPNICGGSTSYLHQGSSKGSMETTGVNMEDLLEQW